MSAIIVGVDRWVSAFFVATLGCNSTASTSSDARAGSKGDAGGSPGTACPAATMTFVVQAAPASTTGYCLGEPGTCTAQWLAIRQADAATGLGLGAPCITSCSDCQPVACTDQCAVPSPLGDGGAQQSWDGTYYANATCGAGLSCVNQACAPPGAYVATFCGYPFEPSDAGLPACTGPATPSTCMSVPFSWPPGDAGTTVVGVLGGDGG